MLIETRYEVVDAQGVVVREGVGIIREGAMGTAEIVYEQLNDLPVGWYTIRPGDISLEVRAEA